MNIEQVKTAIAETPKGANIILEWLRPCKTRKGVSDIITKSVRMVGRMGIDYDNLKAVQEKRDNGMLPAENNGLPWGFWAEAPWLIGNNAGLKKDDPDFASILPTTAFYVRLYNGTSEKIHPETHFFRNGIEVSFGEVENDLLASEKSEKTGDCFTCKVENMTRIHNEHEWLMLYFDEVKQETVAKPIPAKVVAALQNA